MAKRIEVCEVGPRDGFQSIKCAQIPTEQKVEIIEQLLASGVKHMEFTSFVSPKAIPQMADAADVTRAVLERHPDADLFALVPNLRGASNAYALGLRKVCYVVSLSTSHNKANINRTHEQSLDAFKEIRAAYPDLDIIVDLATTFGCPFEGKFEDPAAVVAFLRDYMDQGTADRFLNMDKYLTMTENGSPYIEAYWEDSLEKLAEDMKVDTDAFLATIARYNEMCRAGEDTDFHKDPKYLDPIDDGMYYAVKEYDMTRGEFGGLFTNDKAQVMTTEGEPIEGLYAAGLISSGDLLGDFYPGMEALGVDAYMGFIAGTEAAAHAASKTAEQAA